MNRLIHQFLIGSRPLWGRCVKSVQDYAARIGADYHLETQMNLRIRPKHSQRSAAAVDRHGGLPNCEKLLGTDRLGEYSQVAIIDADVWIKPDAPDIFAAVPPQFDVAGVTERSLPITPAYARKLDGYEKAQYGPLDGVGLPFLQCGLLVYNLSARRLFPMGAKAWWEQPELERFVNGELGWRWQTEQTTLNWWLRERMASIYQLPGEWNALYGAVDPEFCRNAYAVHFFLSGHINGDDPESLIASGNGRPRV